MIIIENQDFPHAGERFRFAVAGAIGRTKIEAHIDSVRVLEEECPDPPCHQMFLIPMGTGGSVLRIVVKDSLDNTTERQFTIEESDTIARTMSIGGG